MTKTIWGTTYTLEGNTVTFKGTKGSGSFKGFDGIGNNVVDFGSSCHAHFEHELADKPELTEEEQFESNMLLTCNNVAHLMFTKSQEINNGVSTVSKKECFEMAKKLVFKSYASVIGCKEEVDKLL